MPNYTITPGNTRGFVFSKTAHGKIERVRVSHALSQIPKALKKIPRTFWIVGGVLVGILVYSLIFFIPKTIAFSYAGDTCVRQLTLLPSAQTVSSNEFNVSLEDELKIGSFTYATTKLCAAPKQMPEKGNFTASVGLFGGWFMAKQFSIQVAEPPVAQTSALIGSSISTALPLKINLTTTDTIHTYEVAVADKTATCSSENSELVCDVAPLQLSPETEYTLSILKSFNGADETKLTEGKVTTLPSINLTGGALTDGKTVYDMSKEFAFTFDKTVKDADVVLEQKSGDGYTEVDTSTRIDGTTLYVIVGADLVRKSDFVLTLMQVIADNGSSLGKPLAVRFATSGGPKPATVSVGATGVAQSAKITVTLDQPLKEGTDITKVARVTGVNGSVAIKSPTELTYTIQGGLCVAFSLVLDKGVASGSNNEVSEAWKFDSRTICGTSSVIGYSVKGRAIVAYYFGNGSTTVLFTGGMHGSERSGYTTMQAWADYLMEYGYKIPADKRVVIVPNTNPDGIAAGSRYSSKNVNIDRNFPTANWKADIETTNGTLVNGGGTSAGSEPETRALMALTRQLKPRLEVSYHAQGRLVGANKFKDSVSVGATYASIVGYQTMFYDAEAVMGYPMTGEYEDWMGEEMNIPAILIELPSASGNYLNSQLSAMLRMLSV